MNPKLSSETIYKRMAQLPSSNEARRETRNVKVSVFLTESTASLLDPKIPYLEDLHPNESHSCTITSSETDYKRKKNFQCFPMPMNKSEEGLANETAYFQYGSFSSFSVTETSSIKSDVFSFQPSRQSLPYVLTPTKIYARPLVAVRSLAHDNRLNIQSNRIYITLIESTISRDSNFFCRICHGGESVDDLLTPCRCRGSIALVHLKCLEKWLMESARSHCELCQHHFEVIRKPRHNTIVSLAMFALTPGERMWNFLFDITTFIAYTPIAIMSTYSLMILCENLNESSDQPDSLAKALEFLTILGIAVIDFTYTSWIMMTLQKYYEAWNEFRKSNCEIKILLPKLKQRPFKRRNVIQQGGTK